MDLNKIVKPELLLDRIKTQANIKRIISKCKSSQISLRPHFKTHQSLNIGRWFRSAGITKITVSSVDMAYYFAADGWKDILIAFPFNPRETKRIRQLAKKVALTLTVTCPESARILAESTIEDINVMLKIDCGYGRSGMLWTDRERVEESIKHLETKKNIEIRGLLTHSGNTYKAAKKEDVLSIYSDTLERMNLCRDSLKRNDLLISVGDTPSVSLVESFGTIDELRPGNFAFYDLMQYFIGSCKLEDISVAYACPVVDIQNMGKKAVIYGGGVHLSKESLSYKESLIFGMAVRLGENGWTSFENPIFVTSLSQEHGIIESEQALPPDFQPGGLIGILPVHSCLAANLAGAYTIIQDGEYIDHMNARK